MAGFGGVRAFAGVTVCGAVYGIVYMIKQKNSIVYELPQIMRTVQKQPLW